MPEHHTDLAFTRTLLTVKDRVMVRAIAVGWSQDLTLMDRTKALEIPWSLVEQEARDSGCYIIVLRLKRRRKLEVRNLGVIPFKKGYYLYVGSAKKELTRHMERYKRTSRDDHRQIDQLSAIADLHAAIPIRTSKDLECELAGAVRAVSDWMVPRFGSTNCQCNGHLFGMAEDPVHVRRFIELLMYYRIDRLEQYL
jgi:sugar fermentation stimulation protein A